MESSDAFRAVRTEKELYVKLSSGKRYYYLLPDEETDCTRQADKERLAWLTLLHKIKNKRVNTKKKLKISVNSLMHMNNMYASVIKKDIYIIIIIYRF